jgi:hypothetical protein
MNTESGFGLSEFDGCSGVGAIKGTCDMSNVSCARGADFKIPLRELDLLSTAF